jgi:hypothetical protein
VVFRPGGTSALTLRWGRQADVRIVRRDISGELDDAKVAAYIAKYAVKGTEQIGGIPVRIRSLADLDGWHVTPHVRRLITACWQLGQREEYQHPAARPVVAPARLPRLVLHPLPQLFHHPHITAPGQDSMDPPAARAPRPARHHRRMALLRPGQLRPTMIAPNFSISVIKVSPVRHPQHSALGHAAECREWRAPREHHESSLLKSQPCRIVPRAG